MVYIFRDHAKRHLSLFQLDLECHLNWNKQSRPAFKNMDLLALKPLLDVLSVLLGNDVCFSHNMLEYNINKNFLIFLK